MEKHKADALARSIQKLYTISSDKISDKEIKLSSPNPGWGVQLEIKLL